MSVWFVMPHWLQLAKPAISATACNTFGAAATWAQKKGRNEGDGDRKVVMMNLLFSSIRHCRPISSWSSAAFDPLFFLSGSRVQPIGEPNLKIFEPSTGCIITQTSNGTAEYVNSAVEVAHEAFGKWSRTSPSERADVLRNSAQLIKKYKEELAICECHDSGKTIWESRLDIIGCAETVDFYAGLARTFYGDHMMLGGDSFAYTRCEPLGVVGAIGAWNYPFQMASWKSAPALAAGNAVVFKPSPLTPLTAVMLGEIYKEAGLPDGIYNVIQGGANTGALLAHHPLVNKLTFTGSVGSGSLVMQACAEGIKNVTLELGGKSPFIIFDDVPIDDAVSGAMLANFLNQGQVCSNGTRVFVHEKSLPSFLEKLVRRTSAMKVGDPLLEDTRIGATISPEHAKRVLGFINQARREGHNILYGGERAETVPEFSGGYFLTPCIILNPPDYADISRKEVFGSVMCVYSFTDEEEVVRRANDTEFGLAAGIFTRNLNRAHRMAAALQAGSIYVNNYNICPAGLPFGGIKKSGIGRENASATLQHFTQIKSVYIEGGKVECPF